MKYWNILFVVTLYSFSSSAQQKNYRHEYAYRVDSAIYNYESHNVTDRTKHCKEIIIKQKKEEKEGEEWEQDWKMEKDELLKSGNLIIVKNLSFTGKSIPSTSCGFFLDEKGETLRGPFKSEYGAFRFVEIIGGSINLEQLSSGEPMFSNWLVLRNDELPIKKLRKLADEIIELRLNGIGNKKCIDRKIKKYQIAKSVVTDCIVGKEAASKQKVAPFGISFYTIECSKGVAIVRLNKIAPKTRYVYYNEYIFK